MEADVVLIPGNYWVAVLHVYLKSISGKGLQDTI